MSSRKRYVLLAISLGIAIVLMFVLMAVGAVGRPTFYVVAIPLACYLGWTMGDVFQFGGSAYWQEAKQRIEVAEARLEKEPEKAAPAWTVAQARMEQYFGRNLRQANLIFAVSLVVMVVGFGFVVYGIKLGLSNPAALSTSYLAGAFGALSEFIGVTFLVVYRSTLSEANSFMSVLERINTVGMAVQILDSIPDASSELKNQVRAELVQLLVRGGGKAGVPAPKRKGTAAGDSEA
jgi:hypothetical protein